MLVFGPIMVPAHVVEAHDTGFNHKCISCHSLSPQEAATLLKPLNLTVKSVRPSPVSGLFEVVAERAGKEGLVYVDFGKKLLMQGVIVDAGKLQSTSTDVPQDDKKPMP